MQLKLKGQDNAFRYAKAQDLQTHRRSHLIHIKQPKASLQLMNTSDQDKRMPTPDYISINN